MFVRPTDGGAEIQLSQDGVSDQAYALVQWSPDSQAVVAWRTEPGAQNGLSRRVFPSGWGRAKLKTRPYALPGDKFSRYEPNVFGVASRKQTAGGGSVRA